MKVAPVAKLKASLSKYLDEVTRGEDVIITEHGNPVARIIPCKVAPSREELVARGIIRPALDRTPLPADFWDGGALSAPRREVRTSS
jgi:prevent-host-death family protein